MATLRFASLIFNFLTFVLSMVRCKHGGRSCASLRVFLSVQVSGFRTRTVLAPQLARIVKRCGKYAAAQVSFMSIEETWVALGEGSGAMHVSSVSELYAADEVELLLDEIKELEPTSCCAEDIQDFEIAGSVTGAGGRSPVGTEKSWDSHAHYRRPPHPRPAAVAPLYCRPRALCTLIGLLRLLLVLISACVCGLVWSLVGLRPWLLPLPSRVRLVLLAAFSSMLLHTLLIFLDVTRLTLLFPIDWNRLTVGMCVWSVISYICGSSLLLHAVLAAPEYQWAPPHVAQILIAAAGMGLGGGGVSLALGGCALRAHALRAAGSAAPCSASSHTQRSSSVSLRTAYRALPSQPPEPQPGPSRDNPL